jgi:hypothetical protein
MNPQKQFCHNQNCWAYGRKGEEHIVIHSHKEKRYRCKRCQRTFSQTKGTALYLRVTDDELVVALTDGRTLSVPLVWYPRLLNASAEQRSDWELIGDSEGVHWPQIDEDLSAAGLLRGVPAPASKTYLAAARRDVRDPARTSAQEFYGNSLGKLKGQLQGDRSQLESLIEQVPSEEVQARIQELIDSYSAIENSVDQVAQDLEIEDVVNQAAQQAQEAVGQVEQQAQEAAQGAAQQAQDTAVGAAQQAQGAVGQVAGLAGQAGQAQTGPQGGGQEELNATEAARRKAEELGIDLYQIEGSGSGGRITVDDVKSLSRQQR